MDHYLVIGRDAAVVRQMVDRERGPITAKNRSAQIREMVSSSARSLAVPPISY